MSGRKKDNIISGTLQGGKRAAQTNKAKYGEDYYKRIGAIGGSVGKTGGFAAKIKCQCPVIPQEHLIRTCAGTKGGRVSRRTK